MACDMDWAVEAQLQTILRSAASSCWVRSQFGGHPTLRHSDAAQSSAFRERRTLPKFAGAEAWRRLGLACSRLSMRSSATATLSWLPQRQHKDAAVSFHLVRSPLSYGSVEHNSRPCKACVGVQRSNSELTKPRCTVCVAASVRAELEPSHRMAGKDCAWSAEALRGVRCRP
ncbi:hypothetical protein L1887_43422 [Cichorium endivia]|nr:hypothetical protein L1887_43422 [Cichorium endivia]